MKMRVIVTFFVISCVYSAHQLEQYDHTVKAVVTIWYKMQTGDVSYGREIYKLALADLIKAAHQKSRIINQTSKDILNKRQLLDRDYVKEDSGHIVCFLFPRNNTKSKY